MSCHENQFTFSTIRRMQLFMTLSPFLLLKDISRYLPAQNFPITRQTFNCTSHEFNFRSYRVTGGLTAAVCRNSIGDGIDNTESHQQEVRCVLVNHTIARDSSFQLRASRITYATCMFYMFVSAVFRVRVVTTFVHITHIFKHTFDIYKIQK